VVLEQRAGLWVASGGVAAQAGRCDTRSREAGAAEAEEADEALSRAERQAARKLARGAVTAPEGRFTGAIVVEHRRVEAQGRGVRVVIEGCVTGAHAEALAPIDSCRLALLGLSRRTADRARWDGLTVRCPASMGNDIEAAVRRWPGLDAAGRRALVDGLSSTLEAGVRGARQAASTPASSTGPTGGAASPAVRIAAAVPSPNAVAIATKSSAPSSTATPAAPAPVASAPISVVVDVNLTGFAAPARSEMAEPTVPRCPEGTVLFAATADGRAFCLDRTEVTEKAYRGFGSRRPATSVSWREADAHCRRGGGRLPSEAEWRRAATGGVRKHPWGEAGPTCERVNTNACEGTTRGVAAPGDVTPEGVFGLGGNVAEWTSDAWGGDRPDARVVRGGAFTMPPSATTAGFRTGLDWNESYRDGGLGFRCAREPLLEETKAASK
jgi:hypothetical protein